MDSRAGLMLPNHEWTLLRKATAPATLRVDDAGRAAQQARMDTNEHDHRYRLGGPDRF
jgi:hypothetical protein